MIYIYLIIHYRFQFTYNPTVTYNTEALSVNNYHESDDS
jgi:hypothetical protein